jgi:FkbM family methyltransferase
MSSSFAPLLSDLQAVFDDPATRSYPLSRRTPVTEALEHMLYEAIDLIKPDTFLEIGAYEAKFSRDMKAAYPNAEVLALEANPRVHALFVDQLADTGVHYVHKAAGSGPGQAKFFIPEVIAGSKMPYAGRMGSLRETTQRESEMTEVEVEVTTLDLLAADMPGTELCLWIDVEGLVHEVLGGAKETLARAGIVYCELESAPVWKDQVLADSVTETLKQAGFQMVARDCQKWFQHNALFVKPAVAETPGFQEMVEAYTKNALRIFSE